MGNIIILYLGSIENAENIIKFKKKYNIKHLFSNLVIFKNTKSPGKDNIDIKIIGTM